MIDLLYSFNVCFMKSWLLIFVSLSNIILFSGIFVVLIKISLLCFKDLLANSQCSLLVAKDPDDRTDLVITLHGDAVAVSFSFVFHFFNVILQGLLSEFSLAMNFTVGYGRRKRSCSYCLFG